MNSPARHESPSCNRDKRHSPRGGSLARPDQIRTGHSLFVYQSAYQFRTDDAYRNKAGSVLRISACGGAGAAGFLLATPRPSPSFQVDNSAHRGGSIRSLPSISEPRRSPYAQKCKTLWQRGG